MLSLLLALILILLQSPLVAFADTATERERTFQQSAFVDPSARLQKVTVGILPFEIAKDQPDMEQYGSGTMDSLISSFSVVPNFIMVDRGRIDRVMKEQQFAQTGLVDPTGAVKLGKILGAQVLISGSIQSVGIGDDRAIAITANFVNVETGQITASRQVRGKLIEIFGLQEQLASSFLEHRSLKVTAVQQQRIQKVLQSTTNLTAYNYYLQGRKAFLLFTPAGYSEAVKWYNKAIEADPKYALALAALAETWDFWGYQKQQNGKASQDEYEQAYTTAQKALQLNPDLAEAHRAFGQAAGVLNKPERETEARKALELNPNDAENWYELWVASGNSKNPDHRYIRKALALNPDLAAAHLDRGNALGNLDRDEEAIVEFREALRLDPGFATAHYNLAATLYDLKRYEEAISEYREALHINPDYAKAYMHLGITLFDLKRYQEALVAFRGALRVNPKAADGHYNLGNALFNLRQYKEAAHELELYLKYAPDSEDAPQIRQFIRQLRRK